MKKFKFLFLVAAIIASCTLTAQIAINTDGTAPDSSAMLEVTSTTQGFLPSRMTEAQRNAIVSPAAGLVVWCSNCGADGEIQVYNGSAWTNLIGGAASVAPAIGDYYQGGVIFYLDSSGGGLICAVSDQNSAAWGCYGTEIIGADGTAIGTGAQNTIDIEVGCATFGTAADICTNLSLNGYDDWFLPSQNELNKMYLNKATIDATATVNGGGAFASATYWSSSEYSNNFAWVQSFDGGGQPIGNKSFTYRFRAVRAF